MQTHTNESKHRPRPQRKHCSKPNQTNKPTTPPPQEKPTTRYHGSYQLNSLALCSETTSLGVLLLLLPLLLPARRTLLSPISLLSLRALRVDNTLGGGVSMPSRLAHPQSYPQSAPQWAYARGGGGVSAVWVVWGAEVE